MVSKKNMHWLNGETGKEALALHEHKDELDKRLKRQGKKGDGKADEAGAKDSKKESKKNAKGDKAPPIANGIPVNCAAFCQHADR